MPCLETLTIIIPAFDEATRLPRYLSNIGTYLPNPFVKRVQLIVVDDGSRDRTQEVVRSFKDRVNGRPNFMVSLLKHPKNLGKGAAIQTGMQHAKGDWVLIADADGSTPINMLRRLIHEAIEQKAHCAIGSRHFTIDDQVVEQRPFRKFTSKSINLCVKLFCFKGIQDTQCGFKLIKTDIAKRAFEEIKASGWTWDVYLLGWLLKHNYRIVEVAVHWKDMPGSKVSVFGDGPKMLSEVIEIGKWMHEKPVIFLPFSKKKSA